MSNREFAEKDSSFRSACEAVSLNPCGRQASKWRRRRGKAFVEGRAKVEERAKVNASNETKEDSK